MEGLLGAIVQFGAGLILLVLAMHSIRSYFKRRSISRTVSGMRSGIYVEHGMIMDPDSGLVKPQQRPSRQAFLHFR